MRTLSLPAVRRAVRRRRAGLEPDARARRAGSTSALRFLGWSTRPTGSSTRPPSTRASSLIGIWGIGAGIIINLAGLRGIPTELYEAARIDGAGWWAQLRNVTIPMMSPILFYTLILGVVEVLQYFLVPLVLKNGTGEPGGTTPFYNLYLYQTFFTYQELSYGATMAWLLFGIAMLVTLILFRLVPALGLLRGRAMTRGNRGRPQASAGRRRGRAAPRPPGLRDRARAHR